MSAARFADITPETVVVTIDVAEVLRTVAYTQLRAELQRRGLVPIDEVAPVTGQHIRGARGLLDWSLHRLAAEAGVSVSTITGALGIAQPLRAAA